VKYKCNDWVTSDQQIDQQKEIVITVDFGRLYGVI